LDSIKYQRIRGKLSGALMAHSVLAYEPTASTLSFSSVLLGFCQGYVLSPTLFSLFISQLAYPVIEKVRHGIQLVPGVLQLFILFLPMTYLYYRQHLLACRSSYTETFFKIFYSKLQQFYYIRLKFGDYKNLTQTSTSWRIYNTIFT